MDFGLTGHSVVITGGSRGIGLAIAKGFAREGANIALCARGQEGLDAAAEVLRGFGVTVFTQTCDVADPTALKAFIEAAAASLGGGIAK